MHNKSNNKFLFFNAFNSFALNASSTGVLFISSLFYARILGTHEYGIYVYFSSWIAILGIFTGLGTREYFVREAAVLHSALTNIKLRQLVRWGSVSVIQSYIVTSIIASCVAWKMGILNSENSVYTFCAALPLVIIAAQTGIRSAVLRGLNKIVLAQAPESLVKPLFHIILVFIVWLTFGQLYSWNIMLLATVSAGCALFFINRFLDGVLPAEAPNETIPTDQKCAWFRSALPFIVPRLHST